jgi:hypothetical protein
LAAPAAGEEREREEVADDAAAEVAGAGEEGAEETGLGSRVRVEDLGASMSASVLGRGMRKDLV